MSTQFITRDRLFREVAHDLSNTMVKLINADEQLYEQLYQQHGGRLRDLELRLYRTQTDEVAIINEMSTVLIEIGFLPEAEKLLADTLEYCKAQLCTNVDVNTARTLSSLGELHYKNGRVDKAYAVSRQALSIMLSREN